MVTPRGANVWTAVLAAILLVGLAAPARAQLGSLVSPGPLSKAHADLEGLRQCQQCHERGRQVSAPLCLSCHKPVADRIARKVGVHKNVTTDCVSCHVEHAGTDAELRPFDQAGFKHDTETAFKLDGQHAALKAQCAACHKGRSFLEARTTCASCHADVHKGQLGSSCERCHSTAVTFRSSAQAFDHARTRFPLTGSHQSTECASCHRGSTYRVAAFGTCSSCHTSPHAPGTVAGTCTSCHTTTNWASRRFDHAATKFPLVGKHITAPCASCHKVSATRAKPASATCAACHTDPHKGEFRQDCAACHNESGFKPAKFDHASTRFPLVEGHATPACASCHKGQVRNVPAARMAVDFRGAPATCVACHADPHRADLGQTCEACHGTRTFRVPSYQHQRTSALFAGRHTGLACEKCHAPTTMALAGTPARVALGGAHFSATPTACVSCHRDVHLGQVGADCERCHSVSAVAFAPDRFEHASSTFPLTGAHTPLACEKCHASATGPFPAGPGPAVRLTGMSTDCVSCHNDVHLGQVALACETCHDTRAFRVARYTHQRPPRGFFVGPHVAAECEACHKTTTGTFPAGKGTAMAFKVGTECVSCHIDVHRGALGQNCGSCHRLTPLASSHRDGLPAWTAVAPSSHPRSAA